MKSANHFNKIGTAQHSNRLLVIGAEVGSVIGPNNEVLHEDLFHQDEYKLRNYKFPFRTQGRQAASKNQFLQTLVQRGPLEGREQLD